MHKLLEDESQTGRVSSCSQVKDIAERRPGECDCSFQRDMNAVVHHTTLVAEDGASTKALYTAVCALVLNI